MFSFWHTHVGLCLQLHMFSPHAHVLHLLSICGPRVCRGRGCSCFHGGPTRAIARGRSFQKQFLQYSALLPIRFEILQVILGQTSILIQLPHVILYIKTDDIHTHTYICDGIFDYAVADGNAL